MGHEELLGVFGKATKCKCPRCGKKHDVKMRWIGRGTPRVYCSPCLLVVGQHENQENQRTAVLDGTRRMAMS